MPGSLVPYCFSVSLGSDFLGGSVFRLFLKWHLKCGLKRCSIIHLEVEDCPKQMESAHVFHYLHRSATKRQNLSQAFYKSPKKLQSPSQQAGTCCFMVPSPLHFGPNEFPFRSTSTPYKLVRCIEIIFIALFWSLQPTVLSFAGKLTSRYYRSNCFGGYWLYCLANFPICGFTLKTVLAEIIAFTTALENEECCFDAAITGNQTTKGESWGLMCLSELNDCFQRNRFFGKREVGLATID